MTGKPDSIGKHLYTSYPKLKEFRHQQFHFEQKSFRTVFLHYCFNTAKGSSVEAHHIKFAVTNQSVVSINIFPLVNWFRKYLWKARSRFNDNVTQVPLIDWLYIYYLMSAKKYFYCRWRAAKLNPLLSAYSLWGGRGLLSCHICCDMGLVINGFIWKTAPFNHLVQLARGAGNPF